MAKELFGYDEATGTADYLDVIEDGGKLIANVEFTQDVSGLLDRNAELANTGATDAGIKKGLWHYASIPLTVVVELRNKGINIYDKSHHKRMFQEINRNYPYLRVTHRTHA